AVMVMGASAVDLHEMLVGVFSLLLAAGGMFLLLCLADGVARVLHRTGIAVLSKLTGLLLAAIAAQVVFTGISGFLK
ncbi:MarC family protein, partial [Desulfovibrio porci]